MRFSHSYKSVEKSENNSIVKKQYKAYKRTKKHLSEYSLLLYITNSLYSQIFLVIPLSFQIKENNIQ